MRFIGFRSHTARDVTYYSTVLRPRLYLTRFYTPLMNSAVLLRTEILCYRFLSFRKIIFRPNRALVINHKLILFFGDSTFVYNVRRYNSNDYKQFLGVRGSTFSFFLLWVGEGDLTRIETSYVM